MLSVERSIADTIRMMERDATHAIATYLRCLAEYQSRQARADAAFARYFAKRQAGARTSGAAWQRLENLANYASADLETAELDLWLLDIDPSTIQPEG